MLGTVQVPPVARTGTILTNASDTCPGRSRPATPPGPHPRGPFPLSSATSGAPHSRGQHPARHTPAATYPPRAPQPPIPPLPP